MRVVHQQEGLWRDRRRRPLAEADQRFRSVKDLKHRDQFAALDGEVDAAAIARLVERARAEQARVKLAADGQQGVADDLGR